MADSSSSVASTDSIKVSYHDEKNELLGCSHYRRNCLIRGPCCSEFYPCRLCHDEKQQAHEINRHAIHEMVCMKCLQDDPNTQPQAVGPQCSKCHASMARYYCDICKFFDDMPDRQIYHCDSCGICRRGTREQFFHCERCQCCVAVAMKKDHACLEKVLHTDCPVCYEKLFTSTKPVHFMRCGHPIHVTCLQEYFRNGYNTCPVCKKSLVENNLRNHQIALYLRANPMPDEYKGYTATILCNDCVRYCNTPWHFMFHQCTLCGSYNTDLVTKTKDGEEAKLPPGVRVTDPADLPPNERYVPPPANQHQAEDDRELSEEEIMAFFEEQAGGELLDFLGAGAGEGEGESDSEGEGEGEGEDDDLEGDHEGASEDIDEEGDDDGAPAGEDEAGARDSAE